LIVRHRPSPPSPFIWEEIGNLGKKENGWRATLRDVFPSFPSFAEEKRGGKSPGGKKKKAGLGTFWQGYVSPGGEKRGAGGFPLPGRRNDSFTMGERFRKKEN